MSKVIIVMSMIRMLAIVLQILLVLEDIDALFAESGGDPMELTSSSFKYNHFIPKEFTCQGEDINPELVIENIPLGTRSLVLIMDDPDAPMGTWVHWVVYDIAVNSKIFENSVPGKEGMNSFGRKRYNGPCPPSGTHRYFFKVYALDAELNLQDSVDKHRVETAMKSHVLAQAEIMGLYKRQ